MGEGCAQIPKDIWTHTKEEMQKNGYFTPKQSLHIQYNNNNNNNSNNNNNNKKQDN